MSSLFLWIVLGETFENRWLFWKQCSAFKIVIICFRQMVWQLKDSTLLDLLVERLGIPVCLSRTMHIRYIVGFSWSFVLKVITSGYYYFFWIQLFAYKRFIIFQNLLIIWLYLFWDLFKCTFVIGGSLLNDLF